MSRISKGTGCNRWNAVKRGIKRAAVSGKSHSSPYRKVRHSGDVSGYALRVASESLNIGLKTANRSPNFKANAQTIADLKKIIGK